MSASRGQGARGWTSGSETVGAWIELSWRAPVTVRRVTLERNALSSPGMLAGYLSFSDGSNVQVQLSTTSSTTVLPVTARTVDRLRFTVTQAAPGASSVRLVRLRVEDGAQQDDVVTSAEPDGDVARAATLSSSDSAGSGLQALTDGNASGHDPGEVWRSTLTRPGWVQLTWSAPRELTTVAVAGARSGSGLRRGTVEFSDGSSLQLGAVLEDPARPTVVSFLPRVTTSLRLTLDPAPGSEPLALSELSAYQRSAPPLVPAGAASPVPTPPAPTCAPAGARPSDSTGLVVRCPDVGAVVDASVSLQLAVGPAYSAVVASIWSGDGKEAPVATRAAAAADGGVLLTLDLSGVPAGPFAVQLRATSDRRSERVVLLQLYRSGAVAPEPAAPASVDGRSLVFDDEFDRGVSVSATGADADYTAAKPESTGVSQFGDAPFADPAADPLAAAATEGGQYLELPVTPSPTGGSTGALVASARPGGSGFSAQYGYFEARMMAPAAPGTWPAFWMLSTPNLIEPQPAVAEVDAVELYGHNPQGACHTTHEYVGGKDVDASPADCGMRWATSREAAAWHVYGVAVAPTLISFYIDGELVATAPQVRGGGEPLFFLLNLALGGGWPVDLSRVQGRAQLYVDYVRVYV